MSETAEKIINNRSVRFSEAPWYKPGIPVIIGGAGGIGSWLALALGRQEATICIYDFDTVDETNMGGQHFTTQDIGENKAEIVARDIKKYCNVHNTISMGQYTEESMTGPIVFAAFDNMKARKILFDKWADFQKIKNKGIFIDGRLLAEGFKIFAVTADKIDRYREYLWDDNEIPDVPCSYKATTHCSMTIAGMMTATYNNYLTNVVYNANVREVPFLTEVELPLLMINKS